MSDDDLTSFMSGLGYDTKQTIPLESFQSGMRQIMRFTISDKSVSGALAAISKDRCDFMCMLVNTLDLFAIRSPFGAFTEEEVQKALSPAEFAFLKKNPAVFAPHQAVITKTGSPDQSVTVSALQHQAFLEYLSSA